MAVEWLEVEAAAAQIFRVWGSGGDLKWAEQAWAMLVKAELADDANELERCKALLRLLGLADYYYNFCTIYRDEPLEPDYLSWAEELLIAPFRLGQLLGEETALNDEADETRLYQDALNELVPVFEDEVIEALQQGYGDRCQLFIALWRSSLPEEANDPNHPGYLPDQAVLSARMSHGETASAAFGC